MEKNTLSVVSSASFVMPDSDDDRARMEEYMLVFDKERPKNDSSLGNKVNSYFNQFFKKSTVDLNPLIKIPFQTDMLSFINVPDFVLS